MHPRRLLLGRRRSPQAPRPNQQAHQRRRRLKPALRRLPRAAFPQPVSLSRYSLLPLRQPVRHRRPWEHLPFNVLISSNPLGRQAILSSRCRRHISSSSSSSSSSSRRTTRRATFSAATMRLQTPLRRCTRPTRTSSRTASPRRTVEATPGRKPTTRSRTFKTATRAMHLLAATQRRAILTSSRPCRLSCRWRRHTDTPGRTASTDQAYRRRSRPSVDRYRLACRTTHHSKHHQLCRGRHPPRPTCTRLGLAWASRWRRILHLTFSRRRNPLGGSAATPPRSAT
jgi:hypothetical protein